MFVTQLGVDEWAADILRPGYLQRDIPDPTWDQIEDAILALDGEKRTEVALGTNADDPADSPHMIIGGGNQGRYVVYATYDGRRLFDLLRRDTDLGSNDEDMTVVVGGQEGDYPARTVVDVATVLEAARAFALEGKLVPQLNWEEH